MASRTTTVAVVALIGFGAYAAPKTLDRFGTFLGGLVGANDAVVIGEGEGALMVAANAEAKLVNCERAAILAQRSCDGLRILIVEAAKVPFIARNTKLAWESGLPAVLTMDRGRQVANRKQACGKFTRGHGGQCDEYPMASTRQGGAGARTEEVPARENLCQGGSYRHQYPPDGEQFLVVVSRPDLIASGSFTGTDIAVDQGCR
ncbi:NucA/NucB deoxyribonuclease domain-containing protein [Actinophytocola oryzae]|uniref:Deoxyribonuclease NucA/NucB n=1 Tax=Actinophytocola oryzae TaxID=502181 RepID=A0A4R7V4H1_9PSEU|nr:NucA/NucB deoxyribonuclease domain-containing protein [Actinophytocola oryzae]TDV43654.1 deoxyribonuclease NucA/NucB [Actinophytocola oryzae]